MSRSRRHRFREDGAAVTTPLVPKPQAQSTPDEANIPLGELEKRTFFQRYWTYGLAVLVALGLWFTVQVASAEETVVPDVATEPEELVEEATVEEEQPSKFKNAIRYLFKDDSSGIMSEAEADYNERVATLDSREHDMNELERILQEQEASLTQELADAEAKRSVLEERIKTLTKCVAHAMDEPVAETEGTP